MHLSLATTYDFLWLFILRFKTSSQLFRELFRRMLQGGFAEELQKYFLD